MTRALRLLVSLLLSAPLLAQVPRSVTPAVGSTQGGEEVLIKGDFGTWPPAVRFGEVPAPAAERLDATTIRVITPRHPAGTVKIWLFDYDMWIDTGLTFRFEEGFPEEAYERVLVPVFLPPLDGAHGSFWVNELRIFNAGREESLTVYGLKTGCIILCPTWAQVHPNEEEWTFVETGRPKSPGAFFYVRRNDARSLVPQLRAYDVSRNATNFGTTIPVVRDHDFTREPITLLAVPTDSRFRNMLRVYAVEEGAEEIAVRIRIEGSGVLREHVIALSRSDDEFDPAYGAFTDFPKDAGAVRVTIETVAPMATPPPSPAPFWAFVSVTNNETQHVTVISPQR